MHGSPANRLWSTGQPPWRQTQPVLRIGQARALNERRGLPSGIMPSPDGRRFLMLSPRAMEGPIELRIVLNWFQELERLAPHPQR